MEEWQKTLVSTGFGFLAGMLGEPVKHWITTQRRKRQIRHSIYREIAQNLWYLESALSIEEGPAEHHGTGGWKLGEVSSEVYDYYRTTSFETLLSLSEYQAFKELYCQIQGFAEARSGLAEKIKTAGLIAGKIRAEKMLGRINPLRLAWHKWRFTRANQSLLKRIPGSKALK